MHFVLLRDCDLSGRGRDRKIPDAVSFKLRDLVTHTFPLERYSEALTLVATGHGQALKVAFVFEPDHLGGQSG